MRKSILAAVLAVLIITSTVCAYAQTVYVMEDVDIYAQPSTSSQKYGTLSIGNSVNLEGAYNGWAMVSSGGYTGYADASKLAEVKAYNGVTVYAKNALTLYQAYSTASKAVKSVLQGEKLLLYATAGDWALVRAGSGGGFTKIADLTTDAPAKTSPESENSAVKTVTGYAKYDGVKVYESYSTSSSVVTTLSTNDTVQVSAIQNGWCQLYNDGVYAYALLSEISNKAVRDETPAPTEKAPDTVTGYAKYDGVKVYESYSTSSSVVTTLSTNDTVQVSAIQNGWCQLYNGGAYAYARLADISNKAIAQESTVYVKNEGAKVYKSYSTSASVLTTLPVNTALTLRATNGDWAQVSAGSAVAYMLLADLSSTKVDVSATPTPTPQSVTAYVKTDGAKVYAANSTSDDVICTLGVNFELSVTGVVDSWCQVKNGDYVGYMRTSDLSSTKVETTVTLKPGDSGDLVKALQSRLKELGYFGGTIGGNYQTLTQSAVSAFQKAAGLSQSGIADAATLAALASDNAPKNTTSSESPSSSAGYSSATPATGTAIEMNWWSSDIQKIFARGVTATVTDVKTGIAWYEYRGGGTNHADVQPLTAADTNSMKKACGSWSWERRAIFVTINGVNYAASMNCMPHGSGSIKNNNFDGHHCIHFTMSRTHGSNSVCSLHQAAIKKALAASL